MAKATGPQRPKTAKASARKRSTKQAEDGEFATMKIKELLKDAGLDHTVLDPKPESMALSFLLLGLLAAVPFNLRSNSGAPPPLPPHTTSNGNNPGDPLSPNSSYNPLSLNNLKSNPSDPDYLYPINPRILDSQYPFPLTAESYALTTALRPTFDPGHPTHNLDSLRLPSFLHQSIVASAPTQGRLMGLDPDGSDTLSRMVGEALYYYMETNLFAPYGVSMGHDIIERVEAGGG
ncbi:hypothetical protein TrRE_jg2815, partial [Triparma retinervis]